VKEIDEPFRLDKRRPFAVFNVFPFNGLFAAIVARLDAERG
jgi:hypothetical protein